MSDTDEELERLRAGCERWAAAYREVLADVEEAPATPEQGRALWAAARDAGIEGKAAVKVRCEEVLGRTIPSFTELTRVEASRVIDEFQRIARDADRGDEGEE